MGGLPRREEEVESKGVSSSPELLSGPGGSRPCGSRSVGPIKEGGEEEKGGKGRIYP